MRQARLPVMPKTLWLCLLVGGAILIPFFLFEAPIETFFNTFATQEGGERWWVAGILFAALALDIYLPIPSSLVSTLCGIFLGVWGGFWLSCTAMTVSGVLGYWTGLACARRARMLLGVKEAVTFERFFQRHGLWVIVALRTIPVLAEGSMLFSGISRLPFRRILLPLMLGNAVVSMVYAVVGAWGKSTDAMVPAFGCSILVSAGMMGSLRFYQRWLSESASVPH